LGLGKISISNQIKLNQLDWGLLRGPKRGPIFVGPLENLVCFDGGVERAIFRTLKM